MYLFVITLGLCLTYFIVSYFFPIFFEKETVKFGKNTFFSVSFIAILSLFSYVMALYIPDLELSNRILHGFGGGFMVIFVSFLAVRDSRISINKFQFFIISILMATALGVVNEIAEFIMHNYMDMIMANSINDTWLDLISNTCGMLIACAFFVPFVNKQSKIV